MIYGRDRERAQLREILDDAIAGHGSLVLISGEAGIGKTTLVDDLIHEARERGCLVLAGGCYDLTTTPPYGPWAEVIRDYAPPDGGAPFPSWFANPEALEQMSSQAQLFEEARRFFAEVANAQPLMIVLEDLHWSDAASLDAFRYLSRHLANIPLLLVATYRDDEITRRHRLFQLLPVLVRESSAVRVHVNRLYEAGVRAMIAGGYRLKEEDLDRLTTHIIQLAEGNPFYAVELLHTLADDGVIRSENGVTTVGPLDTVTVPPLIQQVIERRLSRFDDEQRKHLEAAAVIGHEFDVDIWMAVEDKDEAALFRTIERARELQLIRETSDSKFQFAHALVREALYDQIVWIRRRIWHQSTADLLMENAAANPDAIAYHLQQAHDRRAIDWLIRAADEAEQSIALASANERLEAAIKLMADDRDRENERGWLLLRMADNLTFIDPRTAIANLQAAEQIAVESNDQELRSQARITRGHHLINLGEIRAGLEEMRASLESADPEIEFTRSQTRQSRNPWSTLVSWLALAGHFQETLDVGVPLLDHPNPAMRTVALGVGRAYTALGDPVKALNAFKLSFKAGAATTLPITEQSTGISLLDARVAYFADDVVELRRIADNLSRSYQRAEGAYRAYLTNDQVERVGHTVVLPVRARWDEAEAMFNAHRRSQAVFGRHRSAGHLAVFAKYRGDRAVVEEMVARVLPDGFETEPGDSVFTAGITLLRTSALMEIEAGDLDAAYNWLLASDHWMQWSGAVLGLAEGSINWATYHRATGNHAEAREHAERAYEHASDPRQPLALIAADRFLGQLDVDEGKYDEAEKRLAASLALAERCEAPFEQALTLVVMAERAAKLGGVDEARGLIKRVREICEPLRAKPTLERVDEIEAMLPRVRRGGEEHPFGLTGREVEVLRLVARGRTDAEAAGEMFISPRTVSQHLRNIYNKLNVHNRAEATRVAVEQDIV